MTNNRFNDKSRERKEYDGLVEDINRIPGVVDVTESPEFEEITVMVNPDYNQEVIIDYNTEITRVSQKKSSEFGEVIELHISISDWLDSKYPGGSEKKAIRKLCFLKIQFDLFEEVDRIRINEYNNEMNSITIQADNGFNGSKLFEKCQELLGVKIISVKIEENVGISEITYVNSNEISDENNKIERFRAMKLDSYKSNQFAGYSGTICPNCGEDMDGDRLRIRKSIGRNTTTNSVIIDGNEFEEVELQKEANEYAIEGEEGDDLRITHGFYCDDCRRGYLATDEKEILKDYTKPAPWKVSSIKYNNQEYEFLIFDFPYTTYL